MGGSTIMVAGRAASNVVLVGDPQQLKQRTKGAHPDGALDFLFVGEAGQLSVAKLDFTDMQCDVRTC